MKGVTCRLVVLLTLLVIIQVATAHIGHFDEVWQKRAQEAQVAAVEAYNPHPETVTNNVNKEVRKSFDGKNRTRRKLGKDEGPCMGTNRSSRCWRCRGDWATNRMKLRDCVDSW